MVTVRRGYKEGDVAEPRKYVIPETVHEVGVFGWICGCTDMIVSNLRHELWPYRVHINGHDIDETAAVFRFRPDAEEDRIKQIVERQMKRLEGKYRGFVPQIPTKVEYIPPYDKDMWG